MNRITIKRDEILLKKAKEVFGFGLVTNAFVATWDITDFSVPEEVANRLNEMLFKEDGKRGITYEDIVLEFSNGKMVSFQNSEWASMVDLTADEFYEYKEEE